MNCKICEMSKATEARTYCRTCWNGIVTPAFKHVEGVPPDYDKPFMAWHGWALREAFIAGAAHQMKREKESLTAIAIAGTVESSSGTTKDS